MLVGRLLGSPPVVAVAAIALLGVASAWLATPSFTTFLVFLLLLDARPQDAGSRFDERMLETVLGVGPAYLFGLALPALRARSRTGSKS